jgi:hypothetical protein
LQFDVQEKVYPKQNTATILHAPFHIIFLSALLMLLLFICDLNAVLGHRRGQQRSKVKINVQSYSLQLLRSLAVKGVILVGGEIYDFLK